jgi:hypothetical protein
VGAEDLALAQCDVYREFVKLRAAASRLLSIRHAPDRTKPPLAVTNNSVAAEMGSLPFQKPQGDSSESSCY